MVVIWIILNIISFVFNKFVIVEYYIFSYNILLYHCYWSFSFLNDIWLHYLCLLKRNLNIYFPAYKFLSIYHTLIYQAYQLYSNRYYKRTTSIYQPKRNSSLEPSVFLNQIYKKSIISFPQTRKITDMGKPVSPPKIPSGISITKNFTEKVTKIITPFT